jgi:hypothetical protein
MLVSLCLWQDELIAVEKELQSHLQHAEASTTEISCNSNKADFAADKH